MVGRSYVKICQPIAKQLPKICLDRRISVCRKLRYYYYDVHGCRAGGGCTGDSESISGAPAMVHCTCLASHAAHVLQELRPIDETRLLLLAELFARQRCHADPRGVPNCGHCVVVRSPCVVLRWRPRFKVSPHFAALLRGSHGGAAYTTTAINGSDGTGSSGGGYSYQQIYLDVDVIRRFCWLLVVPLLAPHCSYSWHKAS